MNHKLAIVTYYIAIILGYVWAFVQILASEPFDGLVLFLITFMFQTYRNSIVEEDKK